MYCYLMKYIGTYKILAELDWNTCDYPKDKNGNIDNSYDDFYIECYNGNRIWSYGHGLLTAYIPSLKRGHNIIKYLDETKIPYEKYEENDSEILFNFKSKYIEKIAKILRVKKCKTKMTISDIKKISEPMIKEKQLILKQRNQTKNKE